MQSLFSYRDREKVDIKAVKKNFLVRHIFYILYRFVFADLILIINIGQGVYSNYHDKQGFTFLHLVFQ
jgi:hypothetical protein